MLSVPPPPSPWGGGGGIPLIILGGEGWGPVMLGVPSPQSWGWGWYTPYYRGAEEGTGNKPRRL